MSNDINSVKTVGYSPPFIPNLNFGVETIADLFSSLNNIGSAGYFLRFEERSLLLPRLPLGVLVFLLRAESYKRREKNSGMKAVRGIKFTKSFSGNRNIHKRLY